MTALTADLKRLTEAAEKKAEGKDPFRQKIHLMPPVGWLNDPNGLCQFQGIYHGFFQYSPFNPEGGVKMWGHYTSSNMIDWEYQGVPLYPDQPFDCSGVYSGAAFIEDGEMFLYYTGNVKLEDGEYDYINTGRQANTVLVSSRDGIHFSRKKKLMDNRDYPSDLTLHVRDPKVWKKEDTYYMILGARTKKDEGQVLLYQSEDRIHWSLANRIKTEQPFGYMWECPDYFEIGDRKVLSASVQGLEGDRWKDRNVYQSGYFLLDGEISGNYHLGEYRLWDYGFDYYAPQSFQAEDGRIIQIGWMGMPDCKEYTNRTIEDGWQHCFTFPREIYIKDGIPCQRACPGTGRKMPAAGKKTGYVRHERSSGISGGNFSYQGQSIYGCPGRRTGSGIPGRDGLRCGSKIWKRPVFPQEEEEDTGNWIPWKM